MVKSTAGASGSEGLLNQAMQFHQAGQSAQAEKLYRRVLGIDPQNVRALHYLGVLAMQFGYIDNAVELIGKAVDIQPGYTDALFNLGNAHRRAGKLAEAEQAFRRAIAGNPGHSVFHCNLGNVLIDLGKPEEARAALSRAIELDPGDCLAHNSLGIALKKLGLAEKAEAAYRSAIAANPGYENAHANLARLLLEQGRWGDAEACVRQQLKQFPAQPETVQHLVSSLVGQNRLAEAREILQIACGHFEDNPGLLVELGTVCEHLRQLEAAESHYRRALAVQPAHLPACLGLASVLGATGRTEEAIGCLEGALADYPDDVAVHNNLANLLRDAGRYSEAIGHYEKTLELDPGQAVAFSNLLNAMNFAPDLSAEDVFARHREFGRIFGEPLRPESSSFRQPKDPERRLRIGYVSAGFWNYPVGRFIGPVLEFADRERFENYCYYTHTVRDDVTERCRAQADYWRDCPQVTDAALAEQIRQDEIDILVDLIGHIEGSRLLVFARKPAPVQATWLAYLNTTGLAAMDYRITDGLADPEGLADTLHTEKLYRLPASQWCYVPPAQTPAVTPLPALRNGYVTYGSFNAFTKINEKILGVWAQILSRQPEARLLIIGVPEGNAQAQVAAFMRGQGIGEERITMRPFGQIQDYFDAYQEVDLALDSFPYSGGTTTCDGLWMGVPVVTMPGRTSPSRSSTSLMSNVGLSQFVARDAEDYADLAVHWGRDIEQLAVIRQQLRDRMQTSPLMDGRRFARDLEAGWRSMWRDYCSNS